MKTMAERTKSLISNQTNASKRFKELEDLTQIPGATWRTWWTKDKPPSGEMIESIGRVWPEYIFWMVSGVTDSAHGHIAVPDAYSIEINLREKPEQLSSIQYLRRKTEIFYEMMKQDRYALSGDEIHEIYNLRSARNSERLSHLSRNKNANYGYFDPRMLKLLKVGDDGNDEQN